MRSYHEALAIRALRRLGKADAKVSKTEARYQDEPAGEEQCANCTMFEPPEGCETVAGQISAYGWCKYHEDKVDKALLDIGAPITPASNHVEGHTRSEEALTGDPVIDAVIMGPITRRNIDYPVIDRSWDVPYGSGGSDPLEDPTTFLDRHVPKTLTVSGVTFDPAEPWLVHENVEQSVMMKLIGLGWTDEEAYRVAHFCFAEVAEHAWYRHHGIDPADAENIEKPWLDEIQHENPEHPPPNLYDKPYPHSDVTLAQNEPVEEAKPSADEIERGRALIAAAYEVPPEEKEDMEALSDRAKQALSKQDPKALALFEAILDRISKLQPSAGDVHAPTAIGNEKDKKGKRKNFKAVLEERRQQKPEDDQKVDKIGWTDEARDAARLARQAAAAERESGGYKVGEKVEITGGERMGQSGTIDTIGVGPNKGWYVATMSSGRRFAYGAHHLRRVSKSSEGDDDGEPWEVEVIVTKAEDVMDQHLVFGFASMAELDGKLIVDKQDDMIEPEELEKAAYDFVRYCRDLGDMHERIGVGTLVESMVFTKQKQDLLGIDLGLQGWWVGFRVTDEDVWKRIKAGHLPEFSIGGRALRVPI